MKRLSAVLLAMLLLLTACVSSSEKNRVNSIISTYFLSLNNGDYATANALSVEGDDGVQATIDQNELNDFLFKEISYEIWSIEKDGEGGYSVTAVIEQYGLAVPLAKSITEYDEYCIEAKNSGKEFSDAALSSKWNTIMVKNIKLNKTRTSFQTEMKIVDGKIVITEAFRNAIYGGALDVIKNIDGGNM